MISIDAVIESLPILTETKRAVWAANAIRVIAHGPRRNLRKTEQPKAA